MIYNIPLIIPIVWSGLIYMGLNYSSFINNAMITVVSFQKVIPLVILAGFLLVVLDMVLDPIAVDENRWSWANPGTYYGVPLLNFFGWFLCISPCAFFCFFDFRSDYFFRASIAKSWPFLPLFKGFLHDLFVTGDMTI